MGPKVIYIQKQLEEKIENLELFPKYINIETRNTCNARCSMCAIDFDNRPLITMKQELFNKIVKEISEWKDHVRLVNLYFDNEPLLDRKLHLRIKELKDAGTKRVVIATNASALNQVRSKELILSGLDEIYIGLDSLKKSVYEKIRVRLKFEKVINNIINFNIIRNKLKGKTRIRLQMIYQEENSSEVNDFKKWGKKYLSPNDLIVAHKVHNWGRQLDIKNLTTDKFINSIPCTAIWSNLQIHADGRVALCSNDTKMKSKHTLGYANKSSLAEIWNGFPLKKIRERHLKGERSGYPLCDGCTTWRPINNFSKFTV